MARLWSSGAELQSVTSGIEWDTVTGTPVISTSIKRGGAASVKFNAASTYVTHAVQADTINTLYQRFYIYIETSPSATTPVWQYMDSTPGAACSIRLTSGNVLQAFDDSGTNTVQSSSRALNAGEWYRVDLKYTDSAGSTAVLEWKLDGLLQGTHTGLGGNNASGTVRFGLIGAVTGSIYFDDIGVNNTSGSSQNDYLGEGFIAHLQPAGAGDNNNASSGTYASVDEVTPDGSGTIAVLDANNDILDVTVSSPITAGLHSTSAVTLVQVGIQEAAATANQESWALRIKSASGGTTTQGTTTTHNDTTYKVNGDTTHVYTLTSYTDPTTSSAWTVTGTNSLTNMQIGVIAIDAAPDINVSALWALVEYTGVPRYWLGGTGNWSDTANWSTTSGGSSGASVPTKDYDVVIDSSSGFGSGGTISLDGAYYSAKCRNFTSTSGHNYTIAYSTSDISIYGSFVGESGLTWDTGTWTYFMSSGSATITSNGTEFFRPIFGSDTDTPPILTYGTWTLLDDFYTITSTPANSDIRLQLVSGTLDANDNDLFINRFDADEDVDNTLYMGSGTWTLGAEDMTVWAVDSNNTTLYCETSTIKFIAPATGDNYFYFNGKTYYNLWLTGSYNNYNYIIGSNTFNQIKIDSGPKYIRFESTSTQTVTDWQVQGTAGNLIDIASEPSYYNFNHYGYTSPTSSALYSGLKTAVSQSFTWGGTGYELHTSIQQFYKSGSPTGNVYMKIYAHSGTFGTSSVPTGSALATSDPVDVSTFQTFGDYYVFNFNGANRITLTNGVNYVAVYEYTGGDASNNISIYYEPASYASGNYATYNGSWTADSSKDLSGLDITGSIDGAHTLSKSSGTVDSDYLSLTNSVATGGATWYAGSHSTNVSGNTGWIFDDATGADLVGNSVLTATGNIGWHGSASIVGNSVVSVVGSRIFNSGSIELVNSSYIYGDIILTYFIEASIVANSVVLTDWAEIYTDSPSLIGNSIMNADGQIMTINEEKIYEYKIFDVNGNYTTSLSNVNDYTYNQTINTPGNGIQVELGQTADFNPEVVNSLITESTSEDITTEADEVITAVTASGAQLGAGGTVDINYGIEVWVYYGYNDDLVDENGEAVIDESGNIISTNYGSPDGLRLFAGYISSYSARYGQSETTIINCLPYGADLAQYVITDGGTGTNVAFNSYDPSSGIVRGVLDNFVAQGGTTTYTVSSVPDSNTTVSYTFKLNSSLEGVKKALELAPSNWWWAVNVGTNILHFKPQPTDPTHTFILGKHLKDVTLTKTIENIVNTFYFLGGNTATDPDPPAYIFKKYVDATSVTNYRQKLERQTDQRFTNEDSVDIVGNSKIATNKDPRWTGQITVLSKVYDIETIELGQNIAFSNFGNFIDDLVLQVVGINYTPDAMTITVDSLLPQPSKRLEDIKRNLLQTQTQDVPSTAT